MEKSQICCSLKTAKKLAEAKWDADTVFIWIFCARYADGSFEAEYENPVDPHLVVKEDCSEYYGTNLEDDEWYPAPTAQEIELPYSYKIIKMEGTDEFELHTMVKQENGFYSSKVFNGQSEVELKAQAWLRTKNDMYNEIKPFVDAVMKLGGCVSITPRYVIVRKTESSKGFFITYEFVRDTKMTNDDFAKWAYDRCAED